ncbi:MAG: hypothetical protein ACXVFQ_00710 [Solirubrobacteraceae bacterium]
MTHRAALLAAIGSLAIPATAHAHLRSGTVAVDYRATVSSPRTQAYTARIYQSDHGLSLKLKPGHAVAMSGYLGEPVFRLDRTGLWVNLASPTAVVVGLVKKNQRVAGAGPRWRLQRGRTTVAWHDSRVQRLPSGINRGNWSIPLTVDGRAARLTGELERFARPSLPLWLAILLCVSAVAALPLLARRRDLVARSATGLAITATTASVVAELALAFDAYASPGTWIEGVDSIVFLAVGLGIMFRGPKSLRMAGAVGVGLVSLAVGLLNGAVLLHPIVLAVLPGTIMRLAVVIAVGAGLGTGALGCLHYVDGGLTSLGQELDARFARAVVGGQADRRSASGRDATQGVATALTAQPTDERRRK